jgi:hypothetical protein
VVFEYYWLYRVESGMVDPKYLKSDVFGRYFVPTKNHANFHMVFEYYWLYKVGSGIGDLKISLVRCIWKIFCAYQ